MKKRWITLFAAAALTVSAGMLALTACKDEAEKENFSAPQNLAVEDTVFSWSAVEGASAGYTVKINTGTVTVSSVSLDLDTEGAKVYLVKGNNTLTVKVNATEEKNESEYAQAITYEYTPVKQPLSAPTATVTGDTLFWNAVTGATAGYTVTIGNATLQVNGVTLDLLSAEAKALLARGENTISVKANATDDALESAQSNAIVYRYVIAAEVEAQEFKEAVGAIGTVSLSSGEAISTAKRKYVALSEGAKAEDGVTEAIETLKSAETAYYGLLVDAVVSVDDNSEKATVEGAESALATAKAYEVLSDVNVEAKQAELEQKENALTALKAKIETQVTLFETNVNAAEAAKSAAQSATALESAINTAKETELCNAAKSYEAEKVNGLQAVLDACETALSQWKGEIGAAVAALTHEFAGDDEANYQKATELLTVYAGYTAAYITGDETVAAKHTAIVNAQTTAKGNLDGAISALKEQTDELSSETALSKEYYGALIALKEEINALISGEYGASHWASADTQKVESEISRVKTTVVTAKAENTVFGFGGEGTYYVLRIFYNVLDEEIEFETAPTITYRVNDGESKTEALSKKENGTYIGEIAFNPTLTTTIVYTVTGEQETTVSYNAFKPNIWLAAAAEGSGEYRSLFNNEDKLIINQTGENNYADIYLVTDLDIGSSNDAQIKPLGLPLATKIPVENQMTRAEFYRTIARSEYAELFLGNTFEVRFVFYYTSETDGRIDYSTVSNASVSEKITLALTQDDTKEAINPGAVWDLGVWPGSGNFSLITVAQVGAFVEQFNGKVDGLTITENNVADYLQIRITAYDEETNEVLFAKTAAFGNQTYDYFSFVDEWTLQYFKNDGEDNKAVNFYLTLTIQLKETVAGNPNPLDQFFRDSEQANVSKINDYTGTITFSKSTVTASGEVQFGIATNGAFVLFARGGGGGKAFDNGGKYIILTGTNGTKTFTAYMLKVENSDGKALLYLSTKPELDENAKSFSFYDDAYTDIAVFNEWITDNYSDIVGDGFAADGTWSFTTKVIADGVICLFDGEESQPVTYFYE